MSYVVTVSDVPEFDPTESGFLYAQLADHIAARIDAGELAPGTRLPGVVKLADEYGVAVGTARKAITELRDRGLVFVALPKGTFIAPRQS